MQLAHISLVIVLVFVLSHSVKWIPNIWEFRKAQLGQVISYKFILEIRQVENPRSLNMPSKIRRGTAGPILGPWIELSLIYY